MPKRKKTIYCLSPDEVANDIQGYVDRMFCLTEDEFKDEFEEKWNPTKCKVTITVDEVKEKKRG